MQEDNYASAPLSWRWRLGLCLLFIGPAIYFKMDGDAITAAVCVVAGASAFGGYRAGAAYILALFAAATAAIAYAPSIALSHEWRVSQILGTTGLTNRLISVILVGLLIALLIMLVAKVITFRLFRQLPRLQSINRWMGLGVGAAEGVLAMTIFLGGLLVIEPLEQQKRSMRAAEDQRGQSVSRFILKTTTNTRQSRIGPALSKYNPFTRIPALNKMEEIQQSVRVLSDPREIQDLLEHPSIKQLQSSPTMQRVVVELNNDPELSEILNGAGVIDREKVKTLMNHPAVLELLDQPGFLEEASKVIQDATASESHNVAL